jgi:uncharacterized surface protein with fasciclin (FAS1) repeats
MIRTLQTTAVSFLACLALAGAAQAGDYAAKKDMVDTVAANSSFGTLVVAVKAAGLVDTLKGDGPFTIFAPTEGAFAKLPTGTVEMLLKPANRDKLVAILSHHVAPGRIMAADIAGKQIAVKTVQGQSLDVDVKKGAMVVAANFTTADIETANGAIDVIDSGIMPKS